MNARSGISHPIIYDEEMPSRAGCSITSCGDLRRKPVPMLTPRFIQVDLAPYVGASLDVMRRDAAMMRDTGPTLFTSVRNGEGVRNVMDAIIGAWKVSGAQGKGKSKGKARA